MKKNVLIFGIILLFIPLTGLSSNAYMGDVNGTNPIDLKDAILSLQIMAGIIPQEPVNMEADVNQDQKIGLEETIFILQVIGKIRTDPFYDENPEFENNIGMTFKRISAGTFRMGSLTTETGRDGDETAHNVTISQPYYIQTTEVTQAQWEAVMGEGTNPSYFSPDNSVCLQCTTDCPDWCTTDRSKCPVEQVQWDDVTAFITEINKNSSWGTYRLPTEAEWEYAARAGSTKSFGATPSFPNGADINSSASSFICESDTSLDTMGWYCTNSDRKTHEVALKKVNSFGLYDMHGNVWEWCSDWYDVYPSVSVTDPTGPATGTYRVIRGGGWFNSARLHRSANRVMYKTGRKDFLVGFRLVWVPR